MRQEFQLSVFVMTLAVWLTGCGSDGPRPFLLASPLRAAEIHTEIATIGRAATSLMMTNLSATPRSQVSPNERVTAECEGAMCQATLPWGVTPAYHAAYIGDLNQEVTIRLGAQQDGVALGEFSGSNSFPGWPIFTDYRIYGMWGTRMYVAVEQTHWSGEGAPGTLDGLETVLAYALGVASGSNPLTGSAAWTGRVVALDRLAPDRLVQGAAALTYDFGDQTLDVAFTELGRAPLTWHDLAVEDGRFEDGAGSDRLTGTFYGDQHEEAGGVFERNNLVGAFGATRD